MKKIFLIIYISTLMLMTGCGNSDDDVIRKEEKKIVESNGKENSSEKESNILSEIINDSKENDGEDIKQESSNTTCEKEEVHLSYDWEKDVKNGLLYTSEDGHIVDKDGNVIDEYKDIEVLPNGALMQDDAIFDGYSSGAGGKIYCLYADLEEETKSDVNKDSLEGTYTDYDTNETITIEKNNDGTYTYCMYSGNALVDMFSDKTATLEDGYLAGKLSCVVINEDKSLSITGGAGGAWGHFVKSEDEIIVSGLVANESGICTDVEQGEFNTYMRYDGDVLDELLADAWYDELGTPLADELPKVIGSTYPMRSVLANLLENFEFIQGNLDYLRRYKTPSYDYSYALLIQNIQKRDNGLGEIIYQGTEYFSKETVIFTGNFNGVMNGDDLIMFGVYTGMATDDTVNFEAYYLELHNGEF